MFDINWLTVIVSVIASIASVYILLEIHISTMKKITQKNLEDIASMMAREGALAVEKHLKDKFPNLL